MPYFTRKEVVFAVQWMGLGQEYSKVEKYNDIQYPCDLCGELFCDHGIMRSESAGQIVVCPGDWIITETSGEVYTCKPDIFNKRYTPVWEPTDDTASTKKEDCNQNSVYQVSFTKEEFLADAKRASEEYNKQPDWKKGHLTVSQVFPITKKKTR